MLKHNYHAHSTYCNHSDLTIDEVIQESIKLGLETASVSEHTFLPGFNETSRLANEKDFEKFIKEMNAAKEKYKDQIRVLTGIESEIFNQRTGEALTDHINWLDAHPDVDFVILGHHHYPSKKLAAYAPPQSQEDLDGYVKFFKEAVNNANILYVAHPDVLLKGNGKWTPEIKAACQEMIDAAVAKDIPFGVNVNGFLYGVDFSYPNVDYFKMVAKAGGKGVIELDAHNLGPFQLENIQKAYDLAEEAGLEILEKLI